jgi:hypothetical protein
MILKGLSCFLVGFMHACMTSYMHEYDCVAVPKVLKDTETGKAYVGSVASDVVDTSRLSAEELVEMYITLPEHLPVAYIRHSFRKLSENKEANLP